MRIFYVLSAPRMNIFVNTGNQEVVMESALADDTCQTRDPISVDSPVS